MRLEDMYGEIFKTACGQDLGTLITLAGMLFLFLK